MTAGALFTGSARPARLTAIPWIFAAATVAVQLPCPLVTGSAGAALAIASIVLFFASSVSHALLTRGRAWTAGFLAVTVGGGLLVETVGVHTGWPFGRYAYGSALGTRLYGVPVVVPMVWAMMTYPAYVLARRHHRGRARTVVLAALVLAAWDLFIDPQMVTAGYWRWLGGGPALNRIPLTNTAGWVAVAIAMTAALTALPDRAGSTARDDRAPLALLLWAYVSSTLANLTFFDRPGVAVAGGIAMGAALVAAARDEAPDGTDGTGIPGPVARRPMLVGCGTVRRGGVQRHRRAHGGERAAATRPTAGPAGTRTGDGRATRPRRGREPAALPVGPARLAVGARPRDPRLRRRFHRRHRGDPRSVGGEGRPDRRAARCGAPAGWLGKPHACARAAAAATGTVLVFVDADVTVAPDRVARTVLLLRDAGLDLVSPYPRQEAAGVAERLIQPLLQWSWLALLPLRLAERSTRPSLSAAGGQLLAVDVAAYRRAGGHEGVRDQVIEDVALLRRLKRAGGRGVVADGTDLAVNRMYSGWSQLRDGYAKSLAVAGGSTLGSAGQIGVLAWLFVVPAVAALGGSGPGAVGYLAGVAGRVLAARRTGGRSWPDAAAHPASVSLLGYLTAVSWWRRRRGTARWKGRPVTRCP